MIDELTFWFLVVLASMCIGAAWASASMSGQISREEDDWSTPPHDPDNYR